MALAFLGPGQLEGSGMAIGLSLVVDAFVNWWYKDLKNAKIFTDKDILSRGPGRVLLLVFKSPFVYCIIVFTRVFLGIRAIFFAEPQTEVFQALPFWESISNIFSVLFVVFVALALAIGIFLSSTRLCTYFKDLRAAFPPQIERATIPEDITHKYYGVSVVVGILSFLPGYGIILAPIGLSLGYRSKRKNAIILSYIGLGIQIVFVVLLGIFFG